MTTDPEQIEGGGEVQSSPKPTFAQYMAQLNGDIEVVGRAQESGNPVYQPALEPAGVVDSVSEYGDAATNISANQGGWGEAGSDLDVAGSTPQWAFEAAPPSPPPVSGTYAAENLLAPQPMLGPVGSSRSAIGVFLLSLITGGLYSVSWHRRINREMEDFDPRMQVRPGRSAFAIFIPWALGWLVSLAGAARIVANFVGLSFSFDPHFTVSQAYYLLGGIVVIPYLILLLPFSAVAVAMTLERVRVVEDCTGVLPNKQIRPARGTASLLLPIIGGPILMARMQRRLNAVWSRVAPPASVHYS